MSSLALGKSGNESHLYKVYFSPVEQVTSQSGEDGSNCWAPLLPFPLTLLSKRFTFLLTWKSTLITSPLLSIGCLGATVTTQILGNPTERFELHDHLITCYVTAAMLVSWCWYHDGQLVLTVPSNLNNSHAFIVRVKVTLNEITPNERLWGSQNVQWKCMDIFSPQGGGGEVNINYIFR
jgi:hypothetical protein